MRTGIILFLLSCGLLVACTNKCDKPRLTIVFDGFDSASSDIVIIDRYAKGSDFKKITGQTIFSSHIKRGMVSDTFGFGEVYITSADDIIVFFPLINATYAIKDITINKDRMAAKECTNGVKYSINGIAHAEPNSVFGNSGFGILIQK
jgi:hypothetical protein